MNPEIKNHLLRRLDQVGRATAITLILGVAFHSNLPSSPPLFESQPRKITITYNPSQSVGDNDRTTIDLSLGCDVKGNPLSSKLRDLTPEELAIVKALCGPLDYEIIHP